MTKLQRLAGWVWDQIPVHHQVEIWYCAPKTCRWLERQANRRDREGKR